ncbi:CPBP family intramembrane glutamic endopeptidase [Algibacter sp. L1A34]|uniref:CPBP family intramembrane glutamic endopeptidase n=1 Tax=Algibacter sp. L1A34 TaxID=2686365 RepID=UPI00131C565D|nr:CPBP family intramembrane glutamic endopeptidase [Algibacter sp. L1A34]
MKKSLQFVRFKKFNVLIQLLIFTFILLFIGEILELVFGIFFGNNNFSKLDFSDSSIEYVLFETVILSPLIETFFIQFLLLEFLRVLFNGLSINYFLAVLISGFIFGVLHHYNIPYMIALTILGWMFGYIYVFYKKNKKIHPILAVLITHSLYNLIIVLKDYILVN